MLLDEIDDDVVVVLEYVADDELEDVVVLDVMLQLIEVVDDDEAGEVLIENDEMVASEYLY